MHWGIYTLFVVWAIYPQKLGCMFVKCLTVTFSACLALTIGSSLTCQAATFSTIVQTNQIYTYDMMQRDINRLCNKFPSLIHAEVIGKSAYSRNIFAVSVGRGKKSVLITASHHGREWLTSVLSMKMVEAYAVAYQSRDSICGFPVHKLLGDVTIWFVPMVNPDGVTLAQQGIGKFPRSTWPQLLHWNHGKWDFSEWKSNAQGIDLNRQYQADWEHIDNDDAPLPASKDYKGSRPEEATEVASMVSFCQRIQPRYEVAYHTSGGVIYWGYGNHLGQGRKQRAEELAELTGYRVVNSSGSGGGLTDWWTYTLNKTGFTVEVGPFYGENPVPLRFFSQVWRENQAVGLYLASLAYLEREIPYH